MADSIPDYAGNVHAIDRCLPQRSAIEAGKIGFRALSQGHYPGVLISPDLLPGVRSVGFLNIIGEQDWGTDEHRNEGIEICLQETGRSALIVDGEHHDLEAGSVSVTRPWQLHRLGDPNLGPGRVHYLILDVGVRRPSEDWRWPEWCVLTRDDLAELTTALRGNEHPLWPSNDDIRSVFRRLAALLEDAEPQRHASRILVLLNELLIGLLELMRHRGGVPDEHLSTSRRTVELFLAELGRSPRLLGKWWTLEAMAERCGMGRTAFAAYCRELTNTTPIDFLTRCRLELAAGRLRREPSTPIQSIATESGFASAQYFSRRFSALHGMPPSEWRRRAT